MVALPYMTRNTAAAVLTRIKTEVFGLEEGSSLGAAFERAGIVNVMIYSPYPMSRSIHSTP